MTEKFADFEMFCQQYFTEDEGWRLKWPGYGGKGGGRLAQTPYVSPLCEEMDMVTRVIINQLKDYQPLLPSRKLPFIWSARVVTI